MFADLLVFTNFLDCSVLPTVLFEVVGATAAGFFFCECAAGAARTGAGEDDFFAIFFAGFTDPVFLAAGFPPGRFAVALEEPLTAAFLDGGAFAGFLLRAGCATFLVGAAVAALRAPGFFATTGFFAGALPFADLARTGALLALARLAG